MKNLTEEQIKEINKQLLHRIPEIQNEENSIVKSQLKEKRENLLFEISSWWGGNYPGYSGTIITIDKKLYNYQEEHSFDENTNKPINFFTQGNSLNDEDYSQIIKFIEQKIVPIEYKYQRIYDAGFSILVHYNGINYCIENNTELYQEAKSLIKKIVKN